MKKDSNGDSLQEIFSFEILKYILRIISLKFIGTQSAICDNFSLKRAKNCEYN